MSGEALGMVLVLVIVLAISVYLVWPAIRPMRRRAKGKKAGDYTVRMVYRNGKLVNKTVSTKRSK